MQPSDSQIIIQQLQEEISLKNNEIISLRKRVDRAERLLENTKKYNEDLRSQVDILSLTLHQYRTSGSGSDKAVQTEDEMNDLIENNWITQAENENISIAECVKNAAEQALTQTNFVYDEDSGYYYDTYSQYYYDPRNGLYYNPRTGIYYYFDEMTNSYQYHSKIPLTELIELGKNQQKRKLNLVDIIYDVKRYVGQVFSELALRFIQERIIWKETPPKLMSQEARIPISNILPNPDIRWPSTLRSSTNDIVSSDVTTPSDVQTSEAQTSEAQTSEAVVSDVPFSSDAVTNDISSNEAAIVETSTNETSDKETKTDVGMASDDVLAGESDMNGNGDDDHEDGLESIEEGECSRSSISLTSEQNLNSDEESSIDWPPCIRCMVEDSKIISVPVGTLFIITCSGAKIGREDFNDIHLPDVRISKVHAEINYDSDAKQYFIIDTGSRNGTKLNGNRLAEEKQPSERKGISHEDVVEIGSIHLRLHIHQGLDTCDRCEPGQVKAALEAEKVKTHVILSKEEKEKQRRLELKKIKKRFGLESAQYEVSSVTTKSETLYTDRAKHRRKTKGSTNPYEKTEMASITIPVPKNNIGFKILEKLGWSAGTSLGKSRKGITEPILMTMRTPGTSGLGAENHHWGGGGGSNPEQARGHHMSHDQHLEGGESSKSKAPTEEVTDYQ